MYRWRDYDLSSLDQKYHSTDRPRFYAIDNPREALQDMYEQTYKAGIDLAAETIKPTVIAMKEVVESTFGPNPGTAKAARTIWKYGIFKWMDTSLEYRSKPGYAVDGNLHLARYFMNTYLLEYGDNGLIYNDQEWDEIMLGYITLSDGSRVIRYEVEAGQPKATKKYEVDQYGDRTGDGRWVSGEVTEGLIDAFPKKLRDEILNGRKVTIRDGDGKVVYTYIDYVLPYGLDSTYPETFANYYREKANVQKDYYGALKQIKPRKKVTRP